MENLIRFHPLQERTELIHDRCLAVVADVRAKQISEEWGHGYKGLTVNEIARTYCHIWHRYPIKGNSIESLVGGVQDAATALMYLLQSEKHSDHILGRVPFFHEQNHIAVGYRYQPFSAYSYYYCILISRMEE